MKLTFQQTGGIVATKRGCTLNSDTLDAKTAAKLKRLVEKSGVARAARDAEGDDGGDGKVTLSAAAPPGARDVGGYMITLETDQGKTARVQVSDMTMSESLRPLVEFLQSCAKPLPFK